MIYLQAIGVMAVIGGALAVLLLLADRFLCNYGPCQVRINEEEPFTVQGGGKLLDALYDRRIFIPSACGGQGTCGFCKVQVLEGGGPVLPTELPFLEETELTAGTRLACQVKIRDDIRIRVKEEFLHIQEFRSEVVTATMVTPDTREIHLRLIEPAEIDFRPGQYVQVFVPGTRDKTFRAYSIASPPSRRDAVELLVRLIPGGLGSGYLHRVQPGEEVRFTGPYGEFQLDPGMELVCIGGGCGMAPMRSILRHVAEETPDRKAWLFFGARTAEQVMYHSDFASLAERAQGLEVHYALSEPESSPDWTGETGFIHESADRFLKDGEGKQVFLCGPPPMIKAAIEVLTAKGIPRERIFYDEF
ncbi:MAG: 2Fe-2S iron-sulfur cluster binding domain-containing protein [Lentisphaeria bacterium]|nr:2Fe-2S iron-sulfur cluster binding domain-containing protein [Lentisphaeria bacterium]